VFQRPEHTYDFDPKIIDLILNDEANPLNRIYNLIPDGAKVLDIGAGNGLLALIMLKSGKKVLIDGIEPDSYAVAIGKKYYRNLFCGSAQEFKQDIIQEDYNFIVLADVIEHMKDPLTFLSELCSELSKKTRVVLSIPNISFGAVRISLLNGHFDYVDSGLLEKSHIRFFTLKTILKLVTEIEMNIEKLFYLQRDIFNSEIPVVRSQTNFFCLRRILKDSLSSTYQFLLVLTKNSVEPEKAFYGQGTRLSLTSHIANKLRFK